MESTRRIAKKNTVLQTQTNNRLRVDLLKVDKDCFVDKEWIDAYVKVIVQTCRSYDVLVQTIKMCNSRKKGLHFYIKIHPSVEPERANLLQFLLGDDCLRVNFNRARIASGLLEWNKLFEVAGRRLKTIYREPRNELKVH